ncbi:PQQ-binding-like beta-propeller repeat protein [Roseateles toxinivorans]|uniref:Putative pyrroloquinoline-quinone binding quinoprotein n=1 Tax=Roseateles toxinivorans TaxID=270368 RepID=A0A4R6QRF3_9BURK|nr:PQQ-binding-like beta-propeller repeat protein [Roseateles toxinivorans]TDP73337.1 putative pyrroloquinoline-quinone binding quinoprotein [Roseateles toxinivorans]
MHILLDGGPLMRACVFFCVLLLGGCGGSPEDLLIDKKFSFALSQAEFRCEAMVGGGCADITIAATPLSGYSDARPSWTERADTAGASVVSRIDSHKLADGKWQLRIVLKNHLPVGSYAGVLEFTPFVLFPLFEEYRPASLSYQVTVSSPPTQRPALRALPGAGDWQGSAGNPAHTGAVAVTLDAGRFSLRGVHALPGKGELSTMVAANRMLYLRQTERPDTPGQIIYRSRLLALDEQDGSLKWSYAHPDATRPMTAPAVQGARLMVLADGDKLISFDAVSGAKQHEALQPSTGRTPFFEELAPTLVGGAAYLGRDNDLVSADSVTAVPRWARSFGESVFRRRAGWAAAVNQQMVLAPSFGALRAYGVDDGRELFSVGLPGFSMSGVAVLNEAPVLVDDRSALVLNYRGAPGQDMDNILSLVNLETRSLAWSLPGKFVTHPVVGNGVLYVGNRASQQLEARRLNDGSLLWAWPLADVQETGFRGGLILTNNLLFVAGERKAYAIDLGTHKPVWSFHLSGTLALSANGLLHILNQDSGARWLSTINLH